MDENKKNNLLILCGICGFFALIFASSFLNSKVTYSAADNGDADGGVGYYCPEGLKFDVDKAKCTTTINVLYSTGENINSIVEYLGVTCTRTDTELGEITDQMSGETFLSVEYYCETDASIKIEIPTCNYYYNRSELTFVDTNKYNIVSGSNTAMNVGTYSIMIKPQSGYVWNDGTNSEQKLDCQISECDSEYIGSDTGKFCVLDCAAGTYANGTSCSLCPENYYCPGNRSEADGRKYECPTNSISQSGSQSIDDCICESGYIWNDNSTSCVKKESENPSSSSDVGPSSGSSSITGLSIDKPKCSKHFEYNGKVQNFVSNINGYTIAIKNKANEVVTEPIAAGTYTVTATLEEGNKWSDDSIDQVVFECTIDQAEVGIILSPTSDSGNLGDSGTFKAKITGNASLCTGTLSAGNPGSITEFSFRYPSNSHKITDNEYKEFQYTVVNKDDECKAHAVVKYVLDDPDNCRLPKEKTFTYSICGGCDDCSGCTDEPSSSSSKPSSKLSYTATFMINGSKFKDISCDVQDGECDVEAPEGSCSSGSFKGWFTNSNVCTTNPSAGGTGAGNDLTLTGNKTYYGCCVENLASSSSFSSKPSSSSKSSIDDKPSSSNVPSSSSLASSGSPSSDLNDKTNPIYSIVLGDSSLCKSEETNVSFSVNVPGKVIVSNDSSNVLTLSSSFYEIKANEEKVFKITGKSAGTTRLTVRFEPTDSKKYNIIEKDYTIEVTANCKSNENVTENKPTGGITIFLIWMMGFAAIGYSYWCYKTALNR